MPQLIIINGPEKGNKFLLQEGKNLCGTNSECYIKLNSKEIYPRHAFIQNTTSYWHKIYPQDGEIFVNGKYISYSYTLSHGDLITFGKCTLIYIEEPEPEYPSRTERMPVATLCIPAESNKLFELCTSNICGSSEKCHIRHETLAEQHMEIFYRDGRFVITPIEREFLINGRTVQQERILHYGDVISCGTVEFFYNKINEENLYYSCYPQGKTQFANFNSSLRAICNTTTFCYPHPFIDSLNYLPFFLSARVFFNALSDEERVTQLFKLLSRGLYAERGELVGYKQIENRFYDIETYESDYLTTPPLAMQDLAKKVLYDNSIGVIRAPLEKGYPYSQLCIPFKDNTGKISWLAYFHSFEQPFVEEGDQSDFLDYEADYQTFILAMVFLLTKALQNKPIEDFQEDLPPYQLKPVSLFLCTAVEIKPQIKNYICTCIFPKLRMWCVNWRLELNLYWYDTQEWEKNFRKIIASRSEVSFIVLLRIDNESLPDKSDFLPFLFYQSKMDKCLLYYSMKDFSDIRQWGDNLIATIKKNLSDLLQNRFSDIWDQNQLQSGVVIKNENKSQLLNNIEVWTAIQMVLAQENKCIDKEEMFLLQNKRDCHNPEYIALLSMWLKNFDLTNRYQWIDKLPGQIVHLFVFSLDELEQIYDITHPYLVYNIFAAFKKTGIADNKELQQNLLQWDQEGLYKVILWYFSDFIKLKNDKWHINSKNLRIAIERKYFDNYV